MEGKIVWKVVVENVKTKKEATYDFDAIIVCNGHYSVPHIPDIPGVETFNGIQLHSHSYREPEKFTGLNVVLLGASSSGVDIGLELARHARQSLLDVDSHVLRMAPTLNNMLLLLLLLLLLKLADLDIPHQEGTSVAPCSLDNRMQAI
uniref:Flavin-containing monooxygenase n=1 Tax=Timema cristinae TaxID=61476 RepID=A0A7R9CE68_TIMCR|nr:unnamed protein product [Timema cristinae]